MNLCVFTEKTSIYGNLQPFSPFLGKLVDNSYNSHTDLRYPPGSGGGGLCSATGSTKEGILTKRMATLFNDGVKTTSSPNSIVLEPISDHHRTFENESGNNFLRNGKDSMDLQVPTYIFNLATIIPSSLYFSHFPLKGSV